MKLLDGFYDAVVMLFDVCVCFFSIKKSEDVCGKFGFGVDDFSKVFLNCFVVCVCRFEDFKIKH